MSSESVRPTKTGRAMQALSGMQSAAGSRAGAQEPHAPWTELGDHLESARKSILAEIRNYPPPIAACDQQFNDLLEQRGRIALELSRLAFLRREHSTSETDARALLDFLNASEFVPDELKTRLMQQLSQRAPARTG
jgi:hypothetical protein